jgi:glycosyltransferase involved in cell wall biosynthesis
MPRLPSCSLIISTFNWEAALDLVLGSALRQRRLPDEVLVADDGSGPPTAAVVGRYAERFPVPLRHVWHEDRGFRLAAIRNRALATAQGQYVLSVDGDMVLHPDFVRSHLAFARPRTYVQGGRVMLRGDLTRRLLAGECVDLGPFTRGLGNRINALSAPALAWLHRGARGPTRRTRGCNMGFWLEDARRVNGFNEAIEGWGGEDVEFVARLLNAGVRRRNLKFAGVAYHLHHPTRPMQTLERNAAHLERVLSEGLTRCENGLDKYLIAEEARATPV